MKNFSIFIFLTVLHLNGFSQSNLTPAQVEEYQQLSQELAGTYQIEIIDSRETPHMELSVFPLIQQSRALDSVVYIDLSNTLRVKVLPYSTINSPNFQPVEYSTYVKPSGL